MEPLRRAPSVTHIMLPCHWVLTRQQMVVAAPQSMFFSIRGHPAAGLFGEAALRTSAVCRKWAFTFGHILTHSQAGHRTYKESRQNFINSTINDTELFADGGEANTISTWRVKDTITFSNITVLSAPFGAASHIPTRGETLDGNFGMAKGWASLSRRAMRPRV